MKTVIKKNSVVKVFSDKKEFERYIKQKDIIGKVVNTPTIMSKKVYEEKYFLEFKKIKNQKIRKYINYKRLLKTAAEDLAKIHKIEHQRKELKKVYKEEIFRYKNKINKEDYNKIIEIINNIKGETKIIHGDYSHANILYNKGKNYVIDYEFVKPFDNYYDLNTVYYWLTPTKKIFLEFCKKYFEEMNEKNDEKRMLIARIVFLLNYLEKIKNWYYKKELRKTINLLIS